MLDRGANHLEQPTVRVTRTGFSRQRGLCALLAAAVLVTAVRSDGIAAPNGKTWTSEIAAGAGLLYYLGKLQVDNAKADRTGRAADGVIDWTPLSPALVSAPQAAAKPTKANPCAPVADASMPPHPGSMRAVRARLINDIAKLRTRCPAAFDGMRQRFENLRTCWNAFIIAKATAKPPSAADANQAAPTPKATAGAPAPPPQPTPAPSASPAGNPQAGSTPKPDACTGGFDAIDKVYADRDAQLSPPIPELDERIDITDLQTAVSGAPALTQQILDLRVGSHVDDDALRAHFLYLSGRALDDAILGRQAPFLAFTSTPGLSSGAIDVTAIATSCILNLAPKDCIGALGTAEATAAADRRVDVSCDVARRSWLPSYTAIVRRRIEAHPTDPSADVNADKEPFFGAVPGC
jgi:hypothetical protein